MISNNIIKEPDFICPRLNTLLNKIQPYLPDKVFEEIQIDIINIKSNIIELRDWGKLHKNNDGS